MMTLKNQAEALSGRDKPRELGWALRGGIYGQSVPH